MFHSLCCSLPSTICCRSSFLSCGTRMTRMWSFAYFFDVCISSKRPKSKKDKCVFTSWICQPALTLALSSAVCITGPWSYRGRASPLPGCALLLCGTQSIGLEIQILVISPRYRLVSRLLCGCESFFFFPIFKVNYRGEDVEGKFTEGYTCGKAACIFLLYDWPYNMYI